MRKKLSTFETELLRRIANEGGSYCPSIDLDPGAVRVLHELVKAKRLTVEPTDGPARYHLTSLGWEDAQ